MRESKPIPHHDVITQHNDTHHWKQVEQVATFQQQLPQTIHSQARSISTHQKGSEAVTAIVVPEQSSTSSHLGQDAYAGVKLYSYTHMLVRTVAWATQIGTKNMAGGQRVLLPAPSDIIDRTLAGTLPVPASLHQRLPLFGNKKEGKKWLDICHGQLGILASRQVTGKIIQSSSPPYC